MTAITKRMKMKIRSCKWINGARASPEYLREPEKSTTAIDWREERPTGSMRLISVEMSTHNFQPHTWVYVGSHCSNRKLGISCKPGLLSMWMSFFLIIFIRFSLSLYVGWSFQFFSDILLIWYSMLLCSLWLLMPHQLEVQSPEGFWSHTPTLCIMC